MWAYNCIRFFTVILSLISFMSCKEEMKENIYELKDVQIRQDQVNKRFSKSDIEFISLVYSDLFNKTVPTDEITAMLNLYNASGDKQTIMDMVIRTFLNRQEADIPSSIEMKSNPSTFVINCYKKFFLREPTAYEKHYLVSLIEKDSQITPSMVYYSFLTSKEYKFY